MSRLSLPRAPSQRTTLPVLTLPEKAAWITRHSKPHAAALGVMADHAIVAITEHEARVKRRKRHLP